MTAVVYLWWVRECDRERREPGNGVNHELGGTSGNSCWVNLGHGIGHTSKKSQPRAKSAGYFLTNSPSLLWADLGDADSITFLAGLLQRQLGNPGSQWRVCTQARMHGTERFLGMQDFQC